MPDRAGLQRLQLDGNTELGTLLARGGFEEVDRYDGHHAPGNESGYPAYLRLNGYASEDPWSVYVIAAIGPHGEILSGWRMRNVHLPARVQEPHSETAYMTDQAIAFMRHVGRQPWVLHLSYVKPHWPYMAPAPYHAMYTPDQCLPVVRSGDELRHAHPVVAAYRQQEECVSFQSDACIRTVRPVVQGLISQLDHHLGRLFDAMAASGRIDDTMIVFCSDHGDFLGDHWLGEKELFYDTVQRVPFIVVDPRREADATRGTVEPRFVECVDVVPTILDALDIDPPRIVTASKAAACSRCCTGNLNRQSQRRGATSSSASSTTAFARRACCCAKTSTNAAPSACATHAGATCIGSTSPSSCSICKPIRRSSTTWAAMRRLPRCVRPCARSCWNSWRAGGIGSR